MGATSSRSFLRLFLKFEFAAIFREVAAVDSEEAKGSTAMECERCFSLGCGAGMVEVGRGGGNIWMEGVAPMKGEVPAEGKVRKRVSNNLACNHNSKISD